MASTHSHDPAEVIGQLRRWAEGRPSIRAMLLTSTRAIPGAAVDALSDYDIILVVQDIHPFFEERSWLEDFGEVLVVYWDPIFPDPQYGIERTANVTQYADGLKIDFTLWPVELLRRIVQAPTLTAELDAGYCVLLDKDSLAEGMRPPTYTSYIPTRPTNEVYQTVINDFLSDAPYMAKCLQRGELLPARWCLDYDMKHVYLRPMLEWLVELDHDWALPVGWLGKGLKKHLSAEIWSELESTYAGAEIADNWNALLRTLALFRRVAVDVGKALGYAYPYAMDRRVTDYVKAMQEEARGMPGG